jgi:hypothetical protein
MTRIEQALEAKVEAFLQAEIAKPTNSSQPAPK